MFRPRDTHAAREHLGLPHDAHVVLFAGRLQPLKAPRRAAPSRRTAARRAARACARGSSSRSSAARPGTGLEHPEALADLADRARRSTTSSGSCRRSPPAELALWDAAASVVAVPSYNESFGLVAAEAQAAGTPVIAAAVGGLTTVVADGESGLLLDTHEPDDWAARAAAGSCSTTRCGPGSRQGARDRAGAFSWEDTAERTLDVYERARAALAGARLQ